MPRWFLHAGFDRRVLEQQEAEEREREERRERKRAKKVPVNFLQHPFPPTTRAPPRRVSYVVMGHAIAISELRIKTPRKHTKAYCEATRTSARSSA